MMAYRAPAHSSRSNSQIMMMLGRKIWMPIEAIIKMNIGLCLHFTGEVDKSIRNSEVAPKTKRILPKK